MVWGGFAFCVLYAFVFGVGKFRPTVSIAEAAVPHVRNQCFYNQSTYHSRPFGRSEAEPAMR